MFVESYLIIYDIMPADFIDLTYLISCLLVDLYYTINKIIIKETMKIFCRKLKLLHKRHIHPGLPNIVIKYLSWSKLS